MKTKLILILTILLFLSGLTGCGRGSSGGPHEIIDVVIIPSDSTLKIGNEFPLKANAIYTGGISEDITAIATWSVSDATLATISSKGTISPLKEGKLSITASFEGVSKTAKYTIIDKPRIRSIVVSGLPKSITQGEEQQISIKTTKTDESEAEDEYDTVTFESSDSAILEINEAGHIKAISDGDATITITSKDSDQSEVVSVTVLPSVLSIDLNLDLFYLDLGEETSQNIDITANLSDESTKNVTSLVTWKYGLNEEEDSYKSVISNFNIDTSGKINAKQVGTFFAKPSLNGLTASKSIKVIVENPIRLTALKDTQKEIVVSWNPKVDVTEYKLLWNNTTIIDENTETAESTHIESISESTRFTLPNINPDKTYNFRIAFKRANTDEYSVLSPALQINPIKQQWQHKPGLPGLKEGAAAILFNEDLYIFGGQRLNDAGDLITSNSTSEFDFVSYDQSPYPADPASSSFWVERRAMPTARKGMAACLHNDSIYLFGGSNADDTISNQIIKYQPLIDEWTDTGIAVLPKALTDLTCNTVGDKIFIIGGWDTTEISDAVYIFNPLDEAAELSIAPALRHARYKHASTVVNNTIYVAGGVNGAETDTLLPAETSVESFDAEKSTEWGSIKRLEVARSSLKLLSKGNLLYAFGGMSSDKALLDTVESIDVSSNDSLWQANSKMPYASANYSVVRKENTFYFYGGVNNSVSPVETLKQAIHWDSDLNIWYPSSQPESSVTEFSSAIQGKLLYLIGGRNSLNPNADVQAYDISTNKWSGINEEPRAPSSMEKARFKATTLTYKGNIFVIGGQDKNGDALKSVEIYDKNSNSWTTIGDLNLPRADACAVEYNSQIFVFGGFSPDSKDKLVQKPVKTYEVFEPVSGTWINRGEMSRPARVGASCVTFNDRIYIIGGKIEKELGFLEETSEVDEFIPSKSQFVDTPANMKTARIKPAVSVLNGSIYVFGGYRYEFGNKILITSAEKFLPHNNIAPEESNSWTRLPDMLIGFDNLEAHKVNNKILLIGSRVQSLDLQQIENSIMIFE